MKRIVTIQDISCIGKCSLTVALPIISAMGIETAIIPTAVLFRYNVFSVKGVHFITPLLLIFVPSMKKATRYNQVASLMIEQ